MAVEQEIPDNALYEENMQPQLETDQETASVEGVTEQNQEPSNQKSLRLHSTGFDRSGFVHGLLVGLGIGCIATFVVLWITVFFIPQLPAALTYESLLSMFIYPLIYLLTVGLVALTAGVVKQYYTVERKT